jgi:hypothetical protein
MNEAEKKEFELHLKSCPQCRDSLQIFQEMRRFKKVHSAPSEIIASVFEKTTKKRPFFTFNKTWKLTFAAAACLLAAVFAIPSRTNVKAVNLANAEVQLDEIISINSELDEIEIDFMYV